MKGLVVDVALEERIQEKLNSISDSLSGDALLVDIFTDEIIRACSSAKNAEEFFRGAGIVDQESFDSWNESDCDAFIKANTSYPDWSSFVIHAGKPYIIAKWNARHEKKKKTKPSGKKTPFDSVTMNLTIRPR